MNTTFKEEVPVAPERRAFETPSVAPVTFEEGVADTLEHLLDRVEALESENAGRLNEINLLRDEVLNLHRDKLALLDKLNALMDKHTGVLKEYANCLREQLGMPKE